MEMAGIAILLAASAMLILAGVRGIVRRRLETRFGPDFLGVTAIAFSVFVFAMGAFVGWIALRVAGWM